MNTRTEPPLEMTPERVKNRMNAIQTALSTGDLDSTQVRDLQLEYNRLQTIVPKKKKS